MKVQTLILGDYGTTSTFRLYRFPMPVSPPLTSSSNSPSTLGSKQDHAAMYYYCLEDLERLCVLAPTSSLRDINTVQLYRDFPSTFCKNANDGYTYANTQILYDLATRFKCSLLIDLCQLTEHTPIDQLCSTLQRIPRLDIQKLLLHQQKRQTVPSLSSINNDIHMRLVEQALNPVRLDGQEWFLQPWIQQQPQQCQQNQPLVIRLSPPQEENDQPDLDFSNTESNNVSHTRTKQSSLLLQRRLAPKLGHHAPHLSINTPVYNDHHLHSIKSAPLRKSMSKHHINKRLQAAAAAAAAATNNSHHSTTPPRLHQLLMTSNTSRPHRQYHLPSSPTVPSSLITPTTKKQQFLQPFEHLFDTLEHTRGQKAKLDDTIRQSSTLISKLQQQTTPKMVADKVAEQMEIWMTPYLAQMQHCVDRLEGLEEKWNARICAGPKPRSTITMNNNDDVTTRKAELAELMRRLDQLEQTLVDTTGQ